MTDKLEQLFAQQAITEGLNRYARACDERNWSLFDSVFCDDVEVNYGGEFKFQGRDKVVGMIRSMLGGCGPTQHLLGNISIQVSGDSARSSCYVRADHIGKGDKSQLRYEVWAEYRDEWMRLDSGWRIRQRTMHISQEIGERSVLAPD